MFNLTGIRSMLGRRYDAGSLGLEGGRRQVIRVMRWKERAKPLLLQAKDITSRR